MSETLNWSHIVKHQSPPPSTIQTPSPAAALFRNQLLTGCKSDKGIVAAVVDANAIIQGGDKLAQSASKFVSVPEFRSEVRDPVSRRKIEFLPFEVQLMNPTPESLRTVINFARETGDLQTLSDVDLKLIALTYTLEEQLHGAERIRKCPPPIHVVKAKSLPVKELPGWGSNVPNLEEWDALEREEDEGVKGSRILPIKELELEGGDVNVGDVSEYGNEVLNDKGCQGVQETDVNGEDKRVVGVDASKGEYGDDNDNNDWLPAVSRSTHRRFLRRKARRESSKASSELDADEGDQDNLEEKVSYKSTLQETENTHNDETGDGETVNGEGELSSILEELRLEEEEVAALEEIEDKVVQEKEVAEENGNILEQTDIISEASESVDPSFTDDNSSEQSWMIKSLSDSSVACITSDFAMQNVLIQMGLRLLAPGGMQIRKLQRWVLKCHACYEVTNEVGRLFCPKCGNGGTLRKLAVTVGENGVVLSDRKQRISIRGTKFSLPLPQSGRDAITKNPVLREDQLSHKLLYPKTKKKHINEGDDLFLADDIFHHSEKRAPLKPPVGKAVSMFIGRKNPNDNHNTRARRRS